MASAGRVRTFEPKERTFHATVSGSARSGAGTRTGMALDHLDRIHSERGPAGGVCPDDEGRPRFTAHRSLQIMATPIGELLGAEADRLLKHVCKTIPKQSLHLPGPDYVDRIFIPSDRNQRVINNLARLHSGGRLAGTGYMSILPIDQGIEHSAAASFAPNPLYFDPENIVKLAIEGGCNAVASTFGVLGATGHKWAHRIPYIVKLNHNELLTYPNHYD